MPRTSPPALPGPFQLLRPAGSAAGCSSSSSLTALRSLVQLAFQLALVRCFLFLNSFHLLFSPFRLPAAGPGLCPFPIRRLRLLSLFVGCHSPHCSKALTNAPPLAGLTTRSTLFTRVIWFTSLPFAVNHTSAEKPIRALLPSSFRISRPSSLSRLPRRSPGLQFQLDPLGFPHPTPQQRKSPPGPAPSGSRKSDQ